MARSIELPPDLENDLKMKAANAGLPLDFYAIEVLRRDITAPKPIVNHKNTDQFLELTAELIPRIQAGIAPQNNELTPNKIIDSIRDERESELINHI